MAEEKNIKIKYPSELRSDPLARDWVIVATGRGKRPETFRKERKKRIVPPKKTCPFCHPEEEKPFLVFAEGKKIKDGVKIPKNWTVVALPNKYPALLPSTVLNERVVGPYYRMDGVGYHEVVVTRDHQKSLALFSVAQIEEVINVYQERYLDLMNEPLVNYISIFHNHGQEAGASIFHPHSQIIATPVIDPDLDKAVLSSQKYFQEKKSCLYCLMNDWDRKTGERVVFENKEFSVVCPYVSKTAFEMIISPKKHLPYFERISQEEKKYLAEALKAALGKLYKALNDPPYNFYLHTAPCDGRNYNFYHWHFTILPKTSTWAGF